MPGWKESIPGLKEFILGLKESNPRLKEFILRRLEPSFKGTQPRLDITHLQLFDRLSEPGEPITERCTHHVGPEITVR